MDGGGNTRIEKLAANRQTDFSIDEAAVLALAAWGMQLEAHAKGPRDVEWCLNKEGQLRLLQSRPLKIENNPALFRNAILMKFPTAFSFPRRPGGIRRRRGDGLYCPGRIGPVGDSG